MQHLEILLEYIKELFFEIIFKIKNFLSLIMFYYNNLWNEILELNFFKKYPNYPFQKIGNLLLLILLITITLSFFIKNKKKRYYFSNIILTMVIGIVSVISLNNIVIYNIEKDLIDRLMGFWICLLGLSFYSFIFSLKKISNLSNKRNVYKNFFLCLLYLFLIGYMHSYSDFFLQKLSVNIVKSMFLIIISPLWLYYVPISIVIYVIYVYLIPSILFLGKRKKLLKKGG